MKINNQENIFLVSIMYYVCLYLRANKDEYLLSCICISLPYIFYTCVPVEILRTVFLFIAAILNGHQGGFTGR